MNLRRGFTLGQWHVFPLEGRIESGEENRHLQPKTMDVLLALAKEQGEVVERETLLREIWGKSGVSDEPLTRCIGELRRAFGESKGAPEYILTIPKRGYRLIPTVGDIERGDQAESAKLPLARRMLLGFAALSLVALVAAMMQFSGRDDSQLPRAKSNAPQNPVFQSQAIAVLPFVDLTAAQDHAFFGDGLADELIILLGRNPSLRVVARTSSFSFRDTQTPINEIAELLGVDHVIEGSVRQDGDRFRITAQLVSGEDGYRVWSEIFNEPMDEIFAVQDRISQAVAAVLEVSVLDAQETATRTNPVTYSLYLQARYEMRQGSREALESAADYLVEALTLDDSYAPGWTVLANVYSNLAGQGHWDWDEGFDAAANAARRAIEADPGYPGGFERLAWVAHRHQGDMGAAFENMQFALDLNASSTGTLRSAAVLLLQVGQVDNAIKLLEFCARRSPLDPSGLYNLGVAYVYAGRWQEGNRLFRQILDSNPNYNGAEYQIATTMLLMGQAEASLEWWERLQEHRPLMGKAMAYHDMGRLEESDDALQELISGWGEQWPDTVASVHAFRGDLNGAFEYLQKDFEKFGAAGWGEIKLQPLLRSLHEDPRWQQILAQAGATQEQLAQYSLALNIPLD